MKTPEELLAELNAALAAVEEMKTHNAAIETKLVDMETKHTDLMTQLDAAKEAGSKTDDLVKTISELQDELSDVRTKLKTPAQVVTQEQKQAMHEAVIKPVVGAWVKGKLNHTPDEFFKYVETAGAEAFKALNITNPEDGGLAVAEILSSDVIEYAREYSPILGEVGRKPSMTRNFRELVLVSYPSVQEGIENVAGVTISETSTQEYKEVVSKEFKANAKPRITDAAMYGTDIDVYGDLVRLLGREIGIYLAAQVLYGDGTGKNARGILSSNRIDITDGTGQSWKPTLAPSPANARDADYFPAKSTGVSGALGSDDVARVNLFIDIANELPSEYLSGAKWYMNRKTKGEIEKIRDADEKPIFRTNYMEGQVMLNGFPIVIDDTLPDIEADSTPIMFGDMTKAFAINDGDIDKMLLDPYTVDGCTVVKYDKEMFEMIQASDAIIVVAATTNGPA